jgi:hypothetical protein
VRTLGNILPSTENPEAGPTAKLPPSRYFVFTGPTELITPPVRELAAEVDEVLEYVAARLETSPVELQTTSVQVLGGRTDDGRAWSSQRRDRVEARSLYLNVSAPTGACPARGTANWIGTPSFTIYPNERTTIEQLRGVSAHELAHLFSWALFDGATGALFAEGFATWAAGHYWTEWQGIPSLTAVVHSYREAGTYVPLLETIDLQGTINAGSELGVVCLARRDMFYMEWAAFVEHLVAEHGLPAVLELMRRKLPADATEAVSQHAFDYVGLFGRSLEELEQKWLAAIDGAAP